MAKINVGILTVSDRCSQQLNEDTSGDNLIKLINGGIVPGAKVLITKCISDEKNEIIEVLTNWCDQEQLHLILTTGGTGFSTRDVTPEAVRQVIEKEAPGITTKILFESLKVTQLAVLSRAVCGIRGTSLILTLPGSKKASQECLSFVSGVIPHAIDLLLDRKTPVEVTHAELQSRGTHTGYHHHHGHQHNHQHVHQQGCGANHHNHHKQHVHHSPQCQESQASVSQISQRPRKSPYKMISVAEAQKHVLSAAQKNTTETLPLIECLDHVLAEDIIAKDPLPPFPASIKDGYAVLASDGAGVRQVFGDSTAGSQPGVIRIKAGLCIRINTGAPIPPGADAVVQVEDTELTKQTEDGCDELEIKILKNPIPGQDIRPLGCDISKGQCILKVGTHLRSPELGLIASVGQAKVLVYKKTTVALLSTGNELQEPGSPLKTGHIYDSNKTTLIAILKEKNIPYYDAGIATDNTGNLLNAIKNAFNNADVLVTTGGVSMGEKDLLRPVLESDFSATIHFAQVFMKPGKPTTFATCVYEGKPKIILGLPGNPVSATVTSFLYLIPLCMKSSGRDDCLPTPIRVKLSNALFLDPRPEYHRATLTWLPGENMPIAQSTGHQLSSRLLSYHTAQALLKLPSASADCPKLEKGEIVQAHLLTLPYSS